MSSWLTLWPDKNERVTESFIVLGLGHQIWVAHPYCKTDAKMLWHIEPFVMMLSTPKFGWCLYDTSNFAKRRFSWILPKVECAVI